MACCDLVEDGGKVFTPLSKRCCTDILCLLLFLVYTVVMIVIAIFSLNQGSLNYLIYPQDYTGKFCGADAGVLDKPKAYYPRLAADLMEQSALFAATGPMGFVSFSPKTLCVSECPSAFSLSNLNQTGGPTYPGAAETDPSYYSTTATTEFFNRCLPRIDNQPGMDRYLCGSPTCTAANKTCTTIDSDPTVTTAWVVAPGDEAMCDFRVHEMNTQTFLPPGVDAQTQQWEQWFASYISTAYGVMMSISESYTEVLVMGIAAPFAFSFAWFVLLFLFAGFIIVAALLFFLTMLVALTIYFYVKAGWAGDVAVSVDSLLNFTEATSISNPLASSSSDLSPTWYAVLAVLFTIITLLYIVFLVLSRYSIVRCIAIVREVTKVFFSIPFMAVWPIVEIIFTLLIITYAVCVGGLIATQNPTQFTEIATALNTTIDGAGGVADALASISNNNQTLLIAIMLTIHIVGCIWGLFMTQGGTYTTLARSAAVWFFSHEADSAGQIVQKGGHFPGIKTVTVCCWCVVSRHLGSIAFGAAIITIMTILRIIMSAIDYYTRDAQQSNCMLKMVIKCAQCCIWCLDRTVKFITFYGFIFVAIEGSSFCAACLSTFSFICKYPAQLAVNRLVGNLLRFAITLSIPLGSAALAFFWIGSHTPARPDPWVPVLLVAAIAFFIASAITGVFRCCIDTIFVCSFKDMEEHNPPKFMPSSMRSSFGLDESVKGQTEPTLEKKGSSTQGV